MHKQPKPRGDLIIGEIMVNNRSVLVKPKLFYRNFMTQERESRKTLKKLEKLYTYHVHNTKS